MLELDSISGYFMRVMYCELGFGVHIHLTGIKEISTNHMIIAVRMLTCSTAWLNYR